MLGFVNKIKIFGKELEYQVQKVENGVARLIYANNFIKDADTLTKKDILHRMEQRSSLNERAKTTHRHFILTFGPTDVLTDERMIALSKRYMDKAGFSEQPSVIYRHTDTASPHVHVLTTN